MDSPTAESAPKELEPSIADDFGGWVDQMLGGVQLERTREEELAGLLAPDATREPFGNNWRYSDQRGRFPGQSQHRTRTLYVREGVVRRLTIGQAAVSMPRREELRAKLGRPYVVEGGVVNRYCDPPGHRGLAVYFYYEGVNSTLRTIDIMGPHQANPCR